MRGFRPNSKAHDIHLAEVTGRIVSREARGFVYAGFLGGLLGGVVGGFFACGLGAFFL